MTFKHLCLYLRSLTADIENFSPTIGIQPTFFSPPSEQSVPGGDSPLINFIPHTEISLVLSVDYKLSEMNSLEDISRNFNLSDTKISLIKYRRKSDPFEVYRKAVHKPQRLQLPSHQQPGEGLSLYIGQELTKDDIGELKKGSQLIALYIDDEYDIEKQIKSLVNLLEIKQSENSTDYGFQFEIILKQRCRKIQTLTTNMFCVVLRRDSTHLFLFEVIPGNYHLGGDMRGVKERCVVS